MKNVLSLFSNIGVAEAFFQEIGFNVVVANEIDSRRAALYSSIYPDTEMICGDITNKSVREQIISLSKEKKVNIVMATPPCQGMSNAGQKKSDDERNTLIYPVISIIKNISPDYVFIENVPNFLQTEIVINGCKSKIQDLITKELENDYFISSNIIDMKDYSVPQTRERTIILLTRKKNNLKIWNLPKKDDVIVTMRDAIGHLPKLDPFIKDVSESELLSIFPNYYERKRNAESISRWHTPPHHIKRQVIAMLHTPTGCTAFDNEIYFPKRDDGVPVRGYHNTYKRQNWDTPAYTITMDNRKISSQNNVHPGKKEVNRGEILYSDPRVLTLYELLLIMTLPADWPIPESTSEAFIRRVIGEGIPPLFTKKTFLELG